MAMLGAVLEGFPPGSWTGQQLSGVYRACGEHFGLPRFQGAEAHNGAAHMYRYMSINPVRVDKWCVNTEFTPEENTCAAQVNPLPGGAVPEHGGAGVEWQVSSIKWSGVGGLVVRDPRGALLQPLVLTALVRTVTSLTPVCPPPPPARSPTLNLVLCVRTCAPGRGWGAAHRGGGGARARGGAAGP
jgi:hypothetical protein